MNQPVRRGAAASRGAFARFLATAIVCAALPALAACSSSGGGGGKKKDPPADEGTGLMLVGWETNRSSGGFDGEGDLLFARSTDSGTTWSDPAMLNSDALDDAGADNDVNFATDRNGIWIAVWEWDDGSNIIRFARSTDDGESWSDAAVIHADLESDGVSNENADIATDGNGTWVATWESDYFPVSEGNVELGYSVSTDHGQTWSSPSILAGLDDESESAVLATDRNGRWIAMWEFTDVSGQTDLVYATTDDLEGDWSAEAELAVGTAVVSHADVHTDTDGNGTWVAVWARNNDGSEGVYFSRSTANGDAASWSAPAMLHPFFEDNPGSVGTLHHNGLATDGAGTWVAVWQGNDDLDGGADDLDIHFSRSTDNGASWSAPAQINTDGGSDGFTDAAPSVSTDADGRWIVTWTADRDPNGAGDLDNYFATSTDDGETWSDPEPLNTNAASDASGEHDEDPILKAQ